MSFGVVSGVGRGMGVLDGVHVSQQECEDLPEVASAFFTSVNG